MVWGIIILVGAALDQLVKCLMIQNFAWSTRVPIIGNFVNFTLVMNRGAAFSMLSDPIWGPTVLKIISIVALAVIVIAIIHFRSKRVRGCLSFIAAGALGNLIDRFARGGVVDFVELRFGSWSFPVFNLADAFITCGGAVLIFVLLTELRRERKYRTPPKII